ncbi:mitochondrial intermediate peptidase-like [Ornithodoros turicata]|uniref:mitochondrial intermediate peptidase-like n=1 Tax=Ornithodoros turicata TaxID=34597 RepID=UPI003139E2D0
MVPGTRSGGFLKRVAHTSFRSRALTTWSPLAFCFNNVGVRRTGLRLGFNERTGLFGHSVLREPSGFYLLKEEAISDAETYVAEATNHKRDRKMVQVFDDLSDALCRVADLAEFIRIGHPEGRFSAAALDASASISSLVEKLNTNKELYNALRQVAEHGDIVPTTEEDNHVSKLFLADFEQSGIHLDAETRRKVVALNDHILHVGGYFTNNALQPRSVKKSQLPENIRNCFAIEGENVVIPGLYADAVNELIREAAYRVYLFPDQHQSQLLDELLSSRHCLANLCGFPTYAHRALRGSIAGNPDGVQEFLGILSSELRPRADENYAEMLNMKVSGNRHAKVLHPWDVPYYTSQSRQSRFLMKAALYSPYLSLGCCMDGLNEIFNSLYGVSLEVEEVKNGEVWSPDVIKLAVKEEGGLLGYIYCDFFERPEKPNQDCHFTIQGGRMLPDGTYQVPVVVLMLSLPTNQWTGPPLLTPSMVDNLFHEMGHAMHSMLARTRYQHVTGTRCATDLAEVPSILMEYFASDPRVVSVFARHYQTGEPMPYQMAQSLWQSRYHFSASEMQLQVFYAMLDQKYHGKHPLGKSTTEILAETQDQHYGLPHVPNTAWQLRFGHLVGYGAKYYSYLMSRAVAAWTWQQVFKDNPFSREAGAKYRRELLSHGGSVPAKDLVSSFLQKDVTPMNLAGSLISDIDSALIDAMPQT